MSRLLSVILVLSALSVTLKGQDSGDVLGMDDCIGYALEHSRELAKRELTHEGQRLTTLIRRGKFRPVLSGSESGCRGHGRGERHGHRQCESAVAGWL